ncbi:MAG: hypothetical protein ABI675_25740 [Chitinophagaceae bacterium]
MFKAISTELHIQDKRTIRTYINELLKLNWMGHNPLSGYYFIRSFDFIRKAQQFKGRKAAIFDYREILSLADGFLPGALICEQIKAQQYFWEVSQKRQVRSATKKLGVANQGLPVSDTPRPPYYGLSNKTISTLLFCKMTRACELKQQAESAGYLTTRKHFKEIVMLPMPDFRIREVIKTNYPELGKRIRFRTRRVNRQTVIQVVQQLHDEILPRIEFKNVKRYNRIS